MSSDLLKLAADGPVASDIEVRMEDGLVLASRTSTDKSPLRGQPFIGEAQAYGDPEDCAYRDTIDRDCGNCFYRAFSANPDGDCHIEPHVEDQHPKKLFGIKDGEIMPTEIDGRKVAHFCPSFVDYRAE